jgi:hypothetical protein
MSHKLTSKQIKAIYLLVQGHSAIEVANRLRMRRETLSCWKKIPEFNLEFERVMTEIRDDMRHRLTHLVDRSISTVSYGMASDYCDPRRLRAALSVLKLLGIERAVLPSAPKNDQSGPL